MNPLTNKSILAAVLVGALSASSYGASLNVYLSSPNVESTFIGGASTENFDSQTPGGTGSTLSSSIGTYTFDPTNGAYYQAGNLFGGAGGTTYLSIGAPHATASPYVLNLTTPANYFGFWWSAGDGNNTVSFYSGGVFLATFSTADLITLLNGGSGTVTSIDTLSTYSTSSYYGNPEYTPTPGPPDNNPFEPYGYVNIFSNGTTFDEIRFGNGGSTGTGFESDNHSVYYSVTPPDPENSSVFVKNVPTVPEPSSAMLMLVAGGTLLLARRRRSLETAGR